MRIKRQDLATDVATRAAVYECLNGVLYKNQPFDVVFDQTVKEYPKFDRRDRAFVRDMSMRLLRRMGQVDAVLAAVSDRPLHTISPPSALLILRIGAVQMLYMDVADHAAVDTAVTLAVAFGLAQQKGFINAILRGIGREVEAMKAIADDALSANTPKWMMNQWTRDYGAEVAGEIAAAHLEPAPVDLTTKPDAVDVPAGECLENGSIRLERAGNVTELEGFEDGAWWVQSAAAALPVQILGDELAGKHVVDLCAAPGGKTMQLAAAGANVTAIDISKNRVNRLIDNLNRCQLGANSIVADAKKWQPEDGEKVDIVLVDAPCSATGTIRHQPDVLHLKEAKDVTRLAATQAGILRNAADMLKPGGVLVYCTCSLQREESEDVVAAFLAENPAFTTKAITPDDAFGWGEMITGEGWVRILPTHLKDKGGMDGFFIAQLIRG